MTFNVDNTSVIQMDSSVHARADAIAGGYTNVNGTYIACTFYDTNPDFDCPCTEWGTFYRSSAGTVEDFTVGLDSYNVDCTGKTESYANFQATPSMGTEISASGSSCKVTGTSGNVDLDANNPTSFSVNTLGIGECRVNFFAGPPLSNGDAGYITVQITAAFSTGPGTATHSFTWEIPCGSNP